MKFYLLEGKHLVPFQEIAHLEAEHHAFLQRGYDEGIFCCRAASAAARRVPDRSRQSREDLDAFLAGEPFVREGKMQFIRVTEFVAAQCQDVLKPWFGK